MSSLFIISFTERVRLFALLLRIQEKSIIAGFTDRIFEFFTIWIFCTSLNTISMICRIPWVA